MNDLWLDAAASMVEDAVAELADVGERLAALPMHSAPAAALRLRAGDLEHRIAAASRVLGAYAHAGAPGERDEAVDEPSVIGGWEGNIATVAARGVA
ncbi:hypothetical protein ACE7GA_26995 (plasmid) [Roseomonas sp. CCTCC AB2023176]|uniref:hypothetical protein n=1 Tax=Roseomonas sp. CCTCC AB2023176 TaxID=3342640 RepID=UPI0035D7A1A2